MPDPTKIQFEITEAQRTTLIHYVSDRDITSWVERGTKLAPDQYQITLNPEQLQEIIDTVQFLEHQADQQNTRHKLHQLATYLINQQIE
jgi:hypothetical protein